MTGLVATPAGGRLNARPKVLALPSATMSRLVVLIVAMLAAGLFVGTALFNSILGVSWMRGVAACVGSAPASAVSSVPLELSCAAAGQLQRALVTLASTVVIALAAVAIVLLAPAVLRRRRRLRPGVEFGAATARLAELAHEAGVRAPALMVGPTALRDAFCFGRPGRYAVALPKALAVKPGLPVFEVVARHELAHIAHHDVALSWLARSVWYALAPALGLPLVLFWAHGDFGLGLDYLWRAGVFGGVVVLTQRAVLRSREYDADLRACDAPGVEPVLMGVLTGIRPPTGSRARRVLLALHPDGAQRCRAVERPEQIARVGAVDGLTVGFLTALVSPLLGSTLTALVISNANALLVSVAGTLLVGPLLGATLGVGLWRQAVVARVTGTRTRVSGVVLGVLVGTVLGQAVSLANVGLGSVAGTEHPIFVLVIAVAMSGATVLIAGLGELWASAAGRIGRPAGVWVPAVVLSALLFAGIWWAAYILQNAWDQAGWMVASQVLTATLVPTPMAVLVLTVAAAAAWALRSSSPATPLWLLPDAAPAPTPGLRLRQVVLVSLLGGLTGGLVLVAYRMIAGPAEGDAELLRRFYAYQWAAAATGAAVALGLSLLRGRRGAAAGLLAGPVASALVVVIFLALNTALGGYLNPSFAFMFLRPALVLGLLLSVLGAFLTLGADTGRYGAGKGATAAVFVVTVLLASAGAGATVLGRNVLVPSTGQTLDPVAAAGALSHSTDVLLYRQVEVPTLMNARTLTGPALLAIGHDTSATPAALAQRLRGEVIGPLSESLASAQAFQSRDIAVNEVHQHAIAALRHMLTASEILAQSLETNSPLPEQQIRAERDSANTEWHNWVLGAAALPK